LKIYAYKNTSKSARLLAKALGCKLIKHEGSKFKWGTQPVINWGSRDVGLDGYVTNGPLSVNCAIDKRWTLRILTDAGVSTLPYTTHALHARNWLDEGKTVVCRTLIDSHSGKGIVVAETVGELVDAPLYTQYIPKKFEFRVHVAFNKVIDIQEKLKRKGVEQHDTKIRNHANGYVYGRVGLSDRHVDRLPKLEALGLAAISALGLDFGAVDIIWNEKKKEGYVCEVNSAPGLEGSTVGKYAVAFTANLLP
jgi:glutathione synthase/RimK-type ligase-like ATP-grasp enzyme